jgi:hypothetical protein
MKPLIISTKKLKIGKNKAPKVKVDTIHFKMSKHIFLLPIRRTGLRIILPKIAGFYL